MAKQIKTSEPVSTEEKIKVAARRVFMSKGYAATRTRDIAEEAGINLALLNYYFRSKEKLFQQVMHEEMQYFFGIVISVCTDSNTTLEVKTKLLVDNYFNMCAQNPDIPFFILNEIRNNIAYIKQMIPADKVLKNSFIIHQIKEKNKSINPIHFLMNTLGLIVFSFVVKPVAIASGAASEKEYETLLKERKALIPVWVEAMLKTK